MKKFITYKQLNSAYQDVQRELNDLGLWHANCKITETEVIWCRFPQFTLPTALGFHIDDTGPSGSISEIISRVMGYQPGNIYIPSVSLYSLFARKRWSLRDVVRHEMAHAVMWHYPELGVSSRFYKTFGGFYDNERDVEMKEETFVSEYAMSYPCEDWAETFMWYVRTWKLGLKPGVNRKLARKWKYVESVVKRLRG